MKRMIAVLAAVLCAVLCCIAVFSEEVELQQTVLAPAGENDRVLAFSETGSGFLLIYSDEYAAHLVTDDGRSADTAYGAKEAFIRGARADLLFDFTYYLSVSSYDTDTLTRHSQHALDFDEAFSYDDLLYIETDDLGRVFAVPDSAPTEVYILDPTGRPIEGLSYEEKITGLQILDNTLYVLQPDGAECTALTDSGFGSAAWLPCVPGYPPCRLLTDTLYLDSNGILAAFGEEEPRFDTGINPLDPGSAVVSDGYVYWISGDYTVSRCTVFGDELARCTLSGLPSRITPECALTRFKGSFVLEKFGTFILAPTPTPVPTPSPTPTVTPTVTPKPTRTPKPTATPKPTVTPRPTPTPTPVPTPGPAREQIELQPPYLYAEAGVTAAGLKAALLPEETEVTGLNGLPAAGALRTGMTVTYRGETLTVIVPGDANASGTVNTLDIRLVQNYLLEETALESAPFAAADLNRDGYVDVADLVLLSRRIA